MKKLIIILAFIFIIAAGLLFWAFGDTQSNYASDPYQPAPRPSVQPLPSPTPSPSPSPQIVNLSFAGDVIFDSHIASLIYNKGPEFILEDVRKVFKSSDISMINLETPISLRGKKEADKQFTFRGNPEHIKVLTSSGINMATLANNHILDYGVDALYDTFDILKANDIGYVGAGESLNSASSPLYVEKNGCNIAFIASSHVIPFVSWTAGESKPGVASTYDPSRILLEIENAKKKADIVVVYVHWGEEMKNTPVPYQKNLARMYIDRGADIIIGAHPHVLQGLEFYKGGIISYSLGNFVFTNTKKDTAILNIQIKNKKLSKITVIPCEINNFKTVLIRDAKESNKILETLKSISFGVDILPDGTCIPK